MANTLEFVQGDANITLSGVVVDAESQAPINLAGSALVVHFWSLEDGELKQTLTPTITDAALGKFDLVVTTACLESPGNFEFEMQVTKGAVVQTIPRKQRALIKPQRG